MGAYWRKYRIYLLCFNISWGWGYTVWEWRTKNGKDSGEMREKKIKIEINCSSKCNKTRFFSSIKWKSRLWHKHSDVFYQTFTSNKDFEIFWKLILAHMTGNWKQNYENISCPPLHLGNALKRVDQKHFPENNFGYGQKITLCPLPFKMKRYILNKGLGLTWESLTDITIFLQPLRSPSIDWLNS